MNNYKFVIDWHNYGYTIMQSNFSESTSRAVHLLIKFCQYYEFIFARWGDHHFTVTQAMKLDLSSRAFINQKNITVLYDKPSRQFREQDLYQQLEVSNSNHIINLLYPELIDLPIIISSTSWTKDENFGLFFDAVEEYEKSCGLDSNLPKIVVIITGKGPEKLFYANKIKSKNWENIIWKLPWLEADHYPKILNAATLGVCLHASSSGLDLPMKVVDMLGSGLPVLALRGGSENFVFESLNLKTKLLATSLKMLKMLHPKLMQLP